MSTPITENTTIFEIFIYAMNNVNNFKFFDIILTYFTPDFDYDANYCDIEYSCSHSGDKTISSYLVKYFKYLNIETLEDLDQSVFTDWATNLLNINKNKWKRLYDALVVATYNPIENYDMTEERTVTGQATMTSTQEINQKVTSKIDQTETEHLDQTTTDKIDETKTTGNDIYGFNSNTASPVNNTTESRLTGTDGNTSRVTTGTDGNVRTLATGTGGNTVETQTQGDGNVTTTTTELEPYQLTRHGNIGVTTNVQMLEQEIAFRNKQDFLDIMYSDIDKLLCSKIYN